MAIKKRDFLQPLKETKFLFAKNILFCSKLKRCGIKVNILDVASCIENLECCCHWVPTELMSAATSAA